MTLFQLTFFFEKMSAYYVCCCCCIYSNALQTDLTTEANTMNPDQTTPKEHKQKRKHTTRVKITFFKQIPWQGGGGGGGGQGVKNHKNIEFLRNTVRTP